MVWASGASGTILRTVDGGATWQRLAVPDSEKLDFRDVDAISETPGLYPEHRPGVASRIYKTSDAGAHWTLQFANGNPKAFLNAMAFWDANHGIAFSDSVDGHARHPDDGPTAAMVVARAAENAASGAAQRGCVCGERYQYRPRPAERRVDRHGPTRACCTHETAAAPGRWRPPVSPRAPPAVFSVSFRDPRHGMIVGGNYQKENDAIDNAAVTVDGGGTWTPITGLSGFRSVVTYVPGSRRRSSPWDRPALTSRQTMVARGADCRRRLSRVQRGAGRRLGMGRWRSRTHRTPALVRHFRAARDRQLAHKPRSHGDTGVS